MKRIPFYAIIQIVAVGFFITLVLSGISLYKAKSEIKREIGYRLNLPHVEQYRPLVETYAKAYDVEDEVETLLAIMMQESGGRGNDPMQASESLCGEVGCIDDPEQSIEQGVRYFKQTLDKADGDLKLAIQSYNFGIGFIPYVQERGGKYTEELAIQFSQEMYAKAEDPSIYSCKRKEARQYNACYGDILYVRDVMQYREVFLENSEKKLANRQ